MSNLKLLTFTNIPNKSIDPTVLRREKLISKLNEQLKLVENPSFKVTFNRWKTNDAGEHVVIEQSKPLKPWWFVDLNGDVSLAI